MFARKSPETRWLPKRLLASVARREENDPPREPGVAHRPPHPPAAIARTPAKISPCAAVHAPGASQPSASVASPCDDGATIIESPPRMEAVANGGMAEPILIVDDDPNICEVLRFILTEEGFEVHLAHTAAAALEASGELEILLAVVDLRLGGDDGLEVVRAFTALPATAVLIVSGKTDPVDRVVGLEVGADDYIMKPFDPREFVARVKRHVARMRQLREHRPDPRAAPVFGLGGWRIDLASQSVTDASGRRAPLSPSEFSVLRTLLERRGTVVSRREIAESVSGAASDELDRRVDGHVASIRRKLDLRGHGAIRTVHRRGYVIDVPTAEEASTVRGPQTEDRNGHHSRR